MTTLSLFSRRDPFDAMMRSAFSRGWADSDPIDFMPAAESVREGDDAVIRLEVPGVNVADDVTVELVQNRLVVRGERRDQHAENSEGRSIREIRYGQFERTFALPRHIASDAISASYDAGVLSIRVAGVYAGNEPTRIAIQEGSAPSAVIPASADATSQPDATEQH